MVSPLSPGPMLPSRSGPWLWRARSRAPTVKPRPNIPARRSNRSPDDKGRAPSYNLTRVRGRKRKTSHRSPMRHPVFVIILRGPGLARLSALNLP